MANPTKEATIKRLKECGVREKLVAMEHNPLLNTASSFSANSLLYPDRQIPFVEKHLAYLMDHPKVDPDQYLSNLRLMLKKRG